MTIDTKIERTKYLIWKIHNYIAEYSNKTEEQPLPKKCPIRVRQLYRYMQELLSIWDLAMEAPTAVFSSVPRLKMIGKYRSLICKAIEEYYATTKRDPNICLQLLELVNRFMHCSCMYLGYIQTRYHLIKANPFQSETPTSHSASSSTQE